MEEPVVSVEDIEEDERLGLVEVFLVRAVRPLGPFLFRPFSVKKWSKQKRSQWSN